MNKAKSTLKRAGWNCDAGKENHIFATIPLSDRDMANVKAHLAPDHFESQYGYRSVFITPHMGGFYATSHIRGEYRGYKCRSVSRDYDAGNIFATGKTWEEVTRNFLAAYAELKYNRN